MWRESVHNLKLKGDLKLFIFTVLIVSVFGLSMLTSTKEADCITGNGIHDFYPIAIHSV